MSSFPPDTGAASGVPESAGLVRLLYEQGVPLAEIGRRTGLSTAALYHWIDRKVTEDGAIVLDPLPRRRRPRAGAKGTPKVASKAAPAGAKGAVKGRAKETVKAAATGRARAAVNGAAKEAAKEATKGAGRRATKGTAKAVARRAAQASLRDAAEMAKGAGAPHARLLARLWRAAERQVAQIEARMGPAAPDGTARESDTEKDAKALALVARTLRELAALEDETRAAKGTARKGAQAGEGETHGAEVRDRDAFRRELARRLDRLRAEGPGDAPSE